MKPFSTFLSDLVGKMGQGTLADQLGIDGALLSRFRSGQGALCLEKIDKIFDVAGACIVPAEEKKRMEEALDTMSDLWRKERRKNR